MGFKDFILCRMLLKKRSDDRVDRAGTTQNTDGEPAPVTGGANVQPAVSKAQDAPRGEPTINVIIKDLRICRPSEAV